MPNQNNFFKSDFLLFTFLGKMIVCTFSLLFTFVLCAHLAGTPAAAEEPKDIAEDCGILDTLDHHVSIAMEDAYQGAKAVRKHFRIPEDADAGQIPNQDLYGQAEDPAQLDWLLEDAKPLLDGQSTLFQVDTPILEGSVVNYYLDDSIMAITWKQVFDNIVYTISEVKIDHPSQFRRYLADGEFGSMRHYYSTKMAEMTNAVVASSADFYRNRDYGIVVFERQLRRSKFAGMLDVCYVDSNGDLIFTYRGEYKDAESVQAFVDENDILFSITFGPVLVDNGVRCEPAGYPIGEVNDRYPRAALCQYDKLHYLVIAVTAEGPYNSWQTIHDLAKNIDSFGCQKAYTLDGGQTANIVMNNQLINNMNYNSMRAMSDIIYFATSVPNN